MESNHSTLTHYPGKGLVFIITFSLVFLAAAYLIVFSAFLPGVLNPILLSVAFLMMVVIGLRLKLRIELPLSALLMIIVVTTLTSIDTHRSLMQVWLWLCGFFILYFSAILSRKLLSPLTMTTILLLIGAGFMVFSWQDALGWYSRWLEAYPGEWIPIISYRLNGGNTIAAYYHGLLAIAVVRAWLSHGTFGRVLWGLYSLSALLLLLLSSSRGAYVGLLGALLFMVFLRKGEILSFFRHHLPQEKLKRKLLLAGTGVLVIGAATGGAYWFFGVMSRHPTHGSAISSRGVFWQPAIETFLSNPWLGSGPDTYAGSFILDNFIPPGEIFLHAHNTYLDLLSGSGIFGLLAFGWLMAAILYRLQHRIRSAEREEQIVRYVGLLALTAFLGHSLFDGLYRMPFASLNLCILLGAGLGTARINSTLSEREQKSITQNQWLPLVVGALTVGLGWFLYWQALPYRQGVSLASSGSNIEAATYFHTAIQRDPAFVLPQQQLGILYGLRAASGDETALAESIRHFEDSIAMEPTYSVQYANLGAVYSSDGNLSAAEAAMRQALARAPNWAPYALNLGLILDKQGKENEAAYYYAQTLDLHPDWISAYFWRENSFRHKIALRWAATAVSDTDETTQNEQALIAATRSGPILALASRYLQDGNLESVHRLLQISELVYVGSPELTLEARWLRSALEAARGNFLTAAQQGQAVLEAYLTWGAYGPGSQGWSLYNDGVFHSVGIPTELVPQFTTLPLTGEWDERMGQLASWWGMAGKADRCTEVTERLYDLVPDYSQYRGEVIQCVK